MRHDATFLRSMPGVGPSVLLTLLSGAAEAIQNRDLSTLRCLCGVAPSPSAPAAVAESPANCSTLKPSSTRRIQSSWVNAYKHGGGTDPTKINLQIGSKSPLQSFSIAQSRLKFGLSVSSISENYQLYQSVTIHFNEGKKNIQIVT